MAFRVALASGESFDAEADETLLVAALRAGIKLPHECTLGGCGTCRVKIVEGVVGYESQPLALSEAEAASGYALACQARARSDVAIEVPHVELASPARYEAMITDLAPLSRDVMHLSLVLPDLATFAYRPGQHMNVFLEDGVHRSFSMASIPDGNGVDFHIRRIPGGRFTAGHLDTLQPGDLLDVEIPLGTFCYDEGDRRPLLMVATGTGISPIKCILESLLDDPECPPVSLYWGMREEEDLYLDEQIRGWEGRLRDFRYVPVLSRPGPEWKGRRGHVQQAACEDLRDFAGHSIYLCGSPTMIRDAKREFLERRASIDHIRVDGFNFQSRA
ncbi:MAG: 2Fe-2S iron-sulfur cluster-binding protein [Bacillota bacterium]